MGIVCDQAPCHFCNASHEALRVGLPLGNGRQLRFPLCRKLGRGQHLRQHAGKVVAVLGGKQLFAPALHKAHLHQLF